MNPLMGVREGERMAFVKNSRTRVRAPLHSMKSQTVF